MNIQDWADLHGEWDASDVPEIEQDANGEWYCPKCGRTKRTHRSKKDGNQFCAVDGKPMIWKPDEHTADSIWCGLCETWVERKDLVRWTGDDQLHHLCPGCDADLLPVERME